MPVSVASPTPAWQPETKPEPAWHDQNETSSVKSDGADGGQASFCGRGRGCGRGLGGGQSGTRTHFDYQFGYRKFDGTEGPRTPKYMHNITYYFDNVNSTEIYSVDQELLKDYISSARLNIPSAWTI